MAVMVVSAEDRQVAEEKHLWPRWLEAWKHRGMLV